MDGKTPQAAVPNGGAAATSNGSRSDLSQVLHALQAIYDPASSNDTRREATQYLEQAKQHPDAPSLGHTLALDRSQPAQLRHYGLTMLEHCIKYAWEDFTRQQGEQLRGAVVELAQNISEDDPVYLRNKVAQLWTEIAKRSWADEWMNMDHQLVELWQSSLHHQAVVLYILETLSEEIFNREDATAGLRGSELGRSMVEIFTPTPVLVEQLPKRDKSLDVRFGDEGWLKRLCDNLTWCLAQDYQNQERVRTNAVKTMNTLRASMTWVMPKAIVATNVIEHVCKALAVPVVELQLVIPQPAPFCLITSLILALTRPLSQFSSPYTHDSISTMKSLLSWCVPCLRPAALGYCVKCTTGRFRI
jgi:exportin-5